MVPVVSPSRFVSLKSFENTVGAVSIGSGMPSPSPSDSALDSYAPSEQGPACGRKNRRWSSPGQIGAPAGTDASDGYAPFAALAPVSARTCVTEVNDPPVGKGEAFDARGEPTSPISGSVTSPS